MADGAAVETSFSGTAPSLSQLCRCERRHSISTAQTFETTLACARAGRIKEEEESPKKNASWNFLKSLISPTNISELLYILKKINSSLLLCRKLSFWRVKCPTYPNHST
ncbi:uncharacterized protein RB166_003595 [Leptodactylus fuscus]